MRVKLKSVGTHYYLAQMNCPAVEKEAAWLVFAIAAAHGWSIEHLDIKNAYLLETTMYEKTIFVREMPSRSGTYAHGRTIGRIFQKRLGGSQQTTTTLRHY